MSIHIARFLLDHIHTREEADRRCGFFSFLGIIQRKREENFHRIFHSYPQGKQQYNQQSHNNDLKIVSLGFRRD